MNIFGFMIVKDEADILAQTLDSLVACGNFKKIFIFDNGSSDNTLKVAKKYPSEIFEVGSLTEKFSDNLKFENVYRYSHLFNEGDWFAILDADEIYQEPLLPIVNLAEVEGANFIESRSAQFYFTDQDESYDFDPSLPAVYQRPYYLMNYGEPRVFRYSKDVQLNSDQTKKKLAPLKCCSYQLLIHHFQYRSATQTQIRLNIRLANHIHSNNWGHINSVNWRDYIVPAKHLFRYDGILQAGLPKGANLYKIKDNAAYTMANLNWLKKYKFLTDDELKFFEATRLQRLIKRFL